MEVFNELFGLGKKKLKKYIIGIAVHEPSSVDCTKLSRAIERIVKYYSESVKSYKGISATSARHYFSYETQDNYEFVCTEKNYDEIKRQVKGINPKTILKPGEPYKAAEVASDLRNSISWGVVSSNVKESIKESVESWYTMDWE